MITAKFLKRAFGFDKETRLRKGLDVWHRLDADLPEAKGVAEDDQERLDKFAAAAAKLSYQECYWLKEWLQDEVYMLKQNFCEHSTASGEAFERKWLQIYESHLSLLQG